MLSPVRSTNNRNSVCPGAAAGSSFTSQHHAKLIDLTGDSIPDYITSTSSGGWTIAVGTGAGFASAVPISSGFVLSVNSDSCNTALTSSSAGLVDTDGDGKPELA